MHYKEDKWYIQINPINVVYKNEPKWTNLNGNPTNCVPVELKQNPLPSDILDPTTMQVPSSFKNGYGRGYVEWNWEDSKIQEVKPKDKWIKIRIRYSKTCGNYSCKNFIQYKLFMIWEYLINQVLHYLV